MKEATPLIIIISAIALVLCLKLGLQRIWLSSAPRPYHIEKITAAPEQHILFGKKIDINSAPKNYLTTLPGVGPKLADQIIQMRTECLSPSPLRGEGGGEGKTPSPLRGEGGGEGSRKCFNSIEDIMKVRGIGPKKFAEIRPWITVGQH